VKYNNKYSVKFSKTEVNPKSECFEFRHHEEEERRRGNDFKPRCFTSKGIQENHKTGE
jgi:hypothetical protein